VRSVALAREALARWLAGTPDDAILRWLYRGLIVAAVAVLGLDV